MQMDCCTKRFVETRRLRMRYKILDLDDDVDKNGFELIQLINQTLKLKARLI